MSKQKLFVYNFSTKKMRVIYSFYDVTQKLPRILNGLNPMFSLDECQFTMDQSKQGCARVVAFSQLNITLAYTIESSYCGFNRGEFRGEHIGVSMMARMGAGLLAEGILYLDQGRKEFSPKKEDFHQHKRFVFLCFY